MTEPLTVYCNFCGAHHMERRYILGNPQRNCYICDECIDKLYDKSMQIEMLAALDHTKEKGQ